MLSRGIQLIPELSLMASEALCEQYGDIKHICVNNVKILNICIKKFDALNYFDIMALCLN